MANMVRVSEDEKTPFYDRVATQLTQDTSKGYVINPLPPALKRWTGFLTEYRKKHPGLSLGQAMKGASKEYHKVKRNPSTTHDEWSGNFGIRVPNPELSVDQSFSGKIGLGIPELSEISNQNVLIAGVVGLGVLWAYNRWVAGR